MQKKEKNSVKKLKETTIKLRELEEKYKNLLENANDLIQSVDKNAKFVYVNKKWKGVLGYSDREIKKLNLKSILRKDQISKCMKIFKEVRKGKSFEHIDTVFVTKKGKEVFVSGNATANMKDGKFISTIGIFRDVTERKKAEEDLRESKELYKTLIESSYDLTQSVKPDGSFAFVNEAWLKTLGYTQKEVKKMKVWQIIHPKSLPHCKEIFSDLMKGKQIENVQATFITKKGKPIDVEGNISLMYKEGKIIATHGFFKDVTERKKAEEELKKRVEELEKFHKFTVGRELKMIELKKKIKELESKK